MSTAHPGHQRLSFWRTKLDPLETDDDPPLPAVFDLKQLNDRPTPSLDFAHDLLVNVQRVVRGLLQETFIRDTANIRQPIVELGWTTSGESALGDKVASELLGDGG